jgi:branched-chain amino acid transport system substrate-binding protein
MKLRLRLAAGTLALAASVPASSVPAQELRIGFMATQTGGAAAIGQHAVNGWKIGLDHEGWAKDGDKLGGVPTRMFYADDQLKPDVALKEMERLVTQERIHIGAGFIWTNILLAARTPLLANKRIILSTVAGPSIMAGKECTPYFVSTSWTGEQTAQAAGNMLNSDGIKSLYILVPNYQGGKDIIAGVTSSYKGKVVSQTLFKMGETDFQADISKLRAEKPEAVFYFGPGAMSVSFLRQWAASGAGKEIKLYTHFAVDSITLPVIGESAIGTFHVGSWAKDSPSEINQKFIKDYMAKFGHMPSTFAQQAYDGPRLLAAALKKTGGKFEDPLEFVKLLRHTPYPSARGYFEYNVNGLPIVDFYRREVVRSADGKPQIVTRGTAVKASKDPYWQECPEANRL